MVTENSRRNKTKDRTRAITNPCNMKYRSAGEEGRGGSLRRRISDQRRRISLVAPIVREGTNGWKPKEGARAKAKKGMIHS